MRKHNAVLALWLAIPLLTALNQACVKLLAQRMEGMAFGWQWLVQALQTPLALGIGFCEAASFALWMAILEHTGISKAAPVTAIVYFLILPMGWLFFGEPILLRQILGAALILIGVRLVSTSRAADAPLNALP